MCLSGAGSVISDLRLSALILLPQTLSLPRQPEALLDVDGLQAFLEPPRAA